MTPSWMEAIRDFHKEVATVSSIVSTLAARLESLFQEPGVLKALRAAPDTIASLKANLSTQHGTLVCMMDALAATETCRAPKRVPWHYRFKAQDKVAGLELLHDDRIHQSNGLTDELSTARSSSKTRPRSRDSVDRSTSRPSSSRVVDVSRSNSPSPGRAAHESFLGRLAGDHLHSASPDAVSTKPEPRLPRSSRSSSSRGSPQRSGRVRSAASNRGSQRGSSAEGQPSVSSEVARSQNIAGVWIPAGKSVKKEPVARMRSSCF